MDNFDLDTDKRTSIYSLRMPDLMKARCDRCSQAQSKILNDRPGPHKHADGSTLVLVHSPAHTFLQHAD